MNDMSLLTNGTKYITLFRLCVFDNYTSRVNTDSLYNMFDNSSTCTGNMSMKHAEPFKLAKTDVAIR